MAGSENRRTAGVRNGSRESQGLLGALGDLAGAFLPLSVRRLQQELADRLAKIPTQLNEYGFDDYGMQPEYLERSLLPGALLYRHYFRVDTFDVENVPEGRVLIIGNHAGQLPFDAMMAVMALLLEAEPPRLARGMAEYWVSELPFVSVAGARGGTLVGTRENCIHMLENGECVMAFPEGVRGMNKLYKHRYQLMRFGLGFMRLALATNTPVVPMAIVGSEEQQPGLANLEGLGSLLGMPALPITPTFPLLGPLGLLPLPVKYRIYFGQPMRFRGNPDDEDAAIERRVREVRRSIEALFERGLEERSGIFT